MIQPLECEKHIYELEVKLDDLRNLACAGDVNINAEIDRLRKKVDRMLVEAYQKLQPWDIVQIARHVSRPSFKDYIKQMIEDFTPLSGDRKYADDPALIGGLGRFQGQSVVIIGHQKGHDTESRIKHNFGMAKPEGYRKAVRLMEMADKFRLPIITLIDTPGAHPGVAAEERGQAEAIARCIETLSNVQVPVISVIIGEGGSGGAIALAVGNCVMMLTYAIYSVISPEGCASILWRTNEKKKDAAQALKMCAHDLKALKVIDRIITEPVGGAHRHWQQTISNVSDAIDKELKKLCLLTPQDLQQQRHAKFLSMGRNLGG